MADLSDERLDGMGAAATWDGWCAHKVDDIVAMREEIRRHRAEQSVGKERVRQVVRDACAYATCIDGRHEEFDAIADRVAEQLSAPVLSESALREAYIQGGLFFAAHCTVTDNGAGPSVNAPDAIMLEDAATGYAHRKASAPVLSQPDLVRLRNVRDLLRTQSVCWDLEVALLDRLLGGRP